MRPFLRQNCNQSMSQHQPSTASRKTEGSQAGKYKHFFSLLLGGGTLMRGSS